MRTLKIWNNSPNKNEHLKFNIFNLLKLFDIEINDCLYPNKMIRFNSNCFPSTSSLSGFFSHLNGTTVVPHRISRMVHSIADPCRQRF